MRTYLFLCALLLAPFVIRAEDTTETLLHADTSFPAEGGPAVKLAVINGTLSYLLGGRGTLLLGDNTGIGVASYSLSSPVTSVVNGIPSDLTFSYFGLTVDDFFLSRKLFFLDLSTLVGYGFAAASERNLVGTKEDTSFFVVEPEINLMLNVTKELRIGLGFSYRLLGGSDTESVIGANLSGFAGSLTFMYGK
jgi:hypothetical protein